MIARALAAIVSLAILAACGQPGRYGAWKTYREPAGRYTIRYLDPPWDFVAEEAGTSVFRVANNASAVAGLDAGTAPKYEMRVGIATGTAATLASAEQAAAAGRAEEILVPVTPYTTRSGDPGFTLVSRETTGELRYGRWAWVTGEDGTVVRVVVRAIPDLTEPEADALLESLDVDP